MGWLNYDGGRADLCIGSVGGKEMGLISNSTQCQRLLDHISTNGFINCNISNDLGITQFHARMFELKREPYLVKFTKRRVKYIDSDGKPGFRYDYTFQEGQQELAV